MVAQSTSLNQARPRSIPVVVSKPSWAESSPGRCTPGQRVIPGIGPPPIGAGDGAEFMGPASCPAWTRGIDRRAHQDTLPVPWVYVALSVLREIHERRSEAQHALDAYGASPPRCLGRRSSIRAAGPVRRLIRMQAGDVCTPLNAWRIGATRHPLLGSLETRYGPDRDGAVQWLGIRIGRRGDVGGVQRRLGRFFTETMPRLSCHPGRPCKRRLETDSPTPFKGCVLSPAAPAGAHQAHKSRGPEPPASRRLLRIYLPLLQQLRDDSAPLGALPPDGLFHQCDKPLLHGRAVGGCCRLIAALVPPADAAAHAVRQHMPVAVAAVGGHAGPPAEPIISSGHRNLLLVFPRVVVGNTGDQGGAGRSSSQAGPVSATSVWRRARTWSIAAATRSVSG